MGDSKACGGEMQEPQYSLIVRVVSSVLDKLISGHVDSPKRTVGYGNEFIKFQSSYAPDVTIESYLERIRRYSRCSDACFVMSLIYVDRLIESKNLILTTLNAHRLLITSVMLAAKFHDDLFYNNAYYSKLGGLSLSELNHLESELLHLLDFSLFVQEVAYCKYSMQLQNYVFYLEVMPSPRCPYSEAVARASASQNTSFAAQVPTQTTHVTPARVPPQQRHPPFRYINMDCHRGVEHPATGAGCGVGSIGIPSPDNPHAKAGSFSEHYLCANSPLHMAPASVTPLSHAYARPHQQMLVQQFAQQQQQAQGLVLAQRYAQTYYARDPAESMPPPRARSPLDYTTYDAACVGAAADTAYGVGAISYPPLALGDSMDDSTTACSTRTASPYSTLCSRSSSSNNMMVGAGGGPALLVAQTQTPSVYPVYGSLNSVPAQNVPVAWCDSYASQRGCSSRGDLCIETEGLMDAHLLQRDEPTPTPFEYSAHHQQQLQLQQQSTQQGHAQAVSYQQVSMYGCNSGNISGSAMHTPSGYYAQSAMQTPTPSERVYSSRHPSFSFTPAPRDYFNHGYNSHAGTNVKGECESLTTPRDYYSNPYHAPQGNAGGGSHEPSFQTPTRVSPYPMLYNTSTCANNVNINMHGANLSDPMNFYGSGAGVYAGQM